MKKIIFGLLLLCLVFLSCIQKVDNLFPRVKITNIFPDSAKHGDTLTLTIEYEDCTPSKELVITVDNNRADILEYNDGKTIKIRVPNVFATGNVEGSLPGAESVGWYFEKINDFRITSAHPTEGRNGTRITVKGFDLSYGYNNRFVINTMVCPLISLTDTMAVIEIPEGCGSGAIRIHSDIQEQNNCDGSNLYSGPFFAYQFDKKKQVLSSSEEYGSTQTYTHTYERDAIGRAIKKNFQGSYELYSYGSDGLIDTLFYYLGEDLQAFWVYSRDTQASIVESTCYNYKNEFKNLTEYHYLNEELVQKNLLVRKSAQNTDLYIRESHQYIYGDYYSKYYKKTYTQDGAIEKEDDWYLRYDMDNPKIDENIPGLPEDHSYQLTYLEKDGYYQLVFNEHGNLKKVFSKRSACDEFELKIHYHYE